MSENIKEVVREKYGETARRVAAGDNGASCCGSSAGCGAADPITSGLYDDAKRALCPRWQYLPRSAAVIRLPWRS